MTAMPEIVIDMTNDVVKRAKLLTRMAQLQGRYRINVTKYRPRRSDRQNRYYWPCFVQPFAEWLREHGHEDASPEMAHDILKHKFLRVPLIDHATGEEIGESTRSTTELDTSEFNEYLDHCARWLAEFCGIVVPEPSHYHEQQASEAA